MAILLPQSTAYTFRLGPFLDSTDGNTQENALTVAYTDVLLSKAGGALTAKAETTNLTGTGANAHYTCILGTGDTGTLGALRVWCHVTGALCVYRDFLIVPALVYNSLVAGSDNLQVDTTQWLGTACATPTINGVPEVDLTHVAGATTNVAALATNVDAILTDTAVIGTTGQGLTSLATQASVNTVDDFIDTEITNIQSRLPAALTANGNMKSSLVEILTTALTETAGQIAAAFKQFFDVGTPTGTMKAITNVVTATNLTTNNDKTGYSISGTKTTLDALNDVSTSQVNTEVDTALADINLDHIAGTATAIPAIPAGTYIDQMMDDGTAVYDRTTDSLQAVRDYATTVKTDTAAILTDTAEIGAAGAGLTAVGVGVGGIQDISFAAGAINAAAIAADTFTSSEFAASAAEKIADAILNRNVAGGSNTGRLVKEALYLLRNKSAIAGGTLTVYQTDDTTSQWTAAVTTAAGNPISEINPD